MRLYYARHAPNPERVMMFLREKDALGAVAVEDVDIMGHGHRDDGFRAVSPLAQLPALQLDDGRSLTESRAICRYLEGAFPEPNLMGRDAEEQAFIEMWDRRVEFGWLTPLAWWLRHGHPGFATIEEQIPELAPRGERDFKRFAAWLDDRLAASDWIAGDRFTIADITAFATVGFARVAKWRPGDELPNLRAWRDRMTARPAAA